MLNPKHLTPQAFMNLAERSLSQEALTSSPRSMFNLDLAVLTLFVDEPAWEDTVKRTKSAELNNMTESQHVNGNQSWQCQSLLSFLLPTGMSTSRRHVCIRSAMISRVTLTIVFQKEKTCGANWRIGNEKSARADGTRSQEAKDVWSHEKQGWCFFSSSLLPHLPLSPL